MKRWTSFAPAFALVVGLVACSNSGTGSTLPTGVQQTVGQAVCDAQAKVLDLVGMVQASSLQSKADLATQLQLLQTQLNSQADSLDSNGQGAINTMNSAGKSEPGAVVTAAAQAADAIRRVPGCPSSSPSA